MSKPILNHSFNYIKNWRTKLLVLLLITLTSSFIVLFLKPFKTAENNTFALLGYSFFIFLAYGLSLIFEFFLFKKKNYWTIGFEIIFQFILFLIGTTGVFWYDLVVIKQIPFQWQGFISFLWRITLPFGLLLITIILFLRYYFGKVFEKPDLYKISLTGSLKADVLNIDIRDIYFIKSSNNYVEVFYLKDQTLKSKLLRSSLTNVQNQIPNFIKCHRSYLINPIKISSLEGTKKKPVIVLTDVLNSIPISSSYYDFVKESISQQKREI